MLLILASVAIGMTSIQDMRSYGATPVTVTVTSNPIGLRCIQEVDNVTYHPPTLTPLVRNDWLINSTHTLVASPKVDGGPGIQYLFSTWSGQTPGNTNYTFTVKESETITAEYTTQFEVSFTSRGLGPDASGTVLTLNGNALSLSQLSTKYWYNSGSFIDYSFSKEVTATVSKRYVWNTTSLPGQIAPTGNLTVSAPRTVTGNYSTQYLLTVKGNVAVRPLGENSSGSNGLTTQWYDSGQIVWAFAKEPNGNYAFDSWKGKGDGSYSGPDNPAMLTVNSPITETASFNVTATRYSTEELTSAVVYSLVVVGALFAVLGLVVEHRANPEVQPTTVSAPSRLKFEQKAEKLRAQRPRGVCQKCGHGNRETAKFCTRCGTSLPKDAA
jgi:hypothetical protein